jgi:hypothetical protein
MEQDPAWKADSSSDGQEIAYILWNPMVHLPCEVPGFRHEMRTPLFWVITQRVVVISYRRFGTTYRSHRQGSRTQNLDH